MMQLVNAMNGNTPPKKLRYPRVLPDLVEQHFDDLDFLWEQRENVIFASDWNLHELHELEERAEAHLDGLRIAEGHGVDLALPALCGEETSAASAATLVVMQSGIPELAQELLATLQNGASPEAREGIRIGLRHAGIGPIRGALLELTRGLDESTASLAADVLAFHRVAVPGLSGLLTAQDPRARELVVGALGRLGSVRDSEILRGVLRDEDPGVYRAALRAAALMGMPGLQDHCRETLQSGEGSRRLEVIRFLGVLGDPASLTLLLNSARSSESTGAAIAAVGALGRVDGIPALLELIKDDEHAVDAGAAFLRITGANDIGKELPPATKDEDAETSELDEGEERQLPDPDKAQAWWEAARNRFAQTVRWQSAMDVSDEGAAVDLCTLPLASRGDLYLCARSRSAGAMVDVELEALAWKQMGGVGG